MALHIDTRKERSITVIRAVGSIYQQDGANQLREYLVECLEEGSSNLVLEANDISGVDEAGVDALRTTQVEAKQVGGDLKIAQARYGFLAAMALHSLESSFPYYASTNDALTSFDEALGTGPRGVRPFDILEFVKEQEAEQQQKEAAGSEETAVKPK